MRFLKRLFSRHSAEQQLDKELRFHRDSAIEAKIASGLTPQQAERAVALEFGGTAQIKEQCRDVQRAPWIEHVFVDFRYGLRSLLKNPGFTLLAIGILAIGIGANTAIFSVVNSILLRPLPYPEAERLISLESPTVRQPAAFERLRAQSRNIDYAACVNNAEVNLIGDGEPMRLSAAQVSANLFQVLGVSPFIGSTFREGDDGPHRGNVLMLSYALWKTRFHGDPAVIGRSFLVDDRQPRGRRDAFYVQLPHFHYANVDPHRDRSNKFHRLLVGRQLYFRKVALGSRRRPRAG